MIVILAPTAQLASDTLRLNPPPALSVEAEYGAFVLEGSLYTAAHHQPIGSPYVGRHTTPYGKPAPCNDENIPVLDDNDVALISHVDLDTIGGLMRASGEFIENKTFWDFAEYIDTNGVHNADPNHEHYVIVNGIHAWLEENHPEIDKSRNNDITDFCYRAFKFIKDTLEGDEDQLAQRMGNAHIYLQKKLADTTFVEQKPSGLIVRKTIGDRVNHLYGEGDAIISFDERYKTITISIADPIANFSCRRLVQDWWGDRAGGHDQIAGSPRGKLMSEQDFIKAIDNFDLALTKAYRDL